MLETYKVLNLCAGLGGNRKKWENVEVTAVEMNPEIAEYLMTGSFGNCLPTSSCKNPKITLIERGHLLFHFIFYFLFFIFYFIILFFIFISLLF